MRTRAVRNAPYVSCPYLLPELMDEGQERVRASYRDDYARLARVKADRDPRNLFRLNQNIQPATGS
ncbi:BBE domain-containing protein [Streptomyces vastus]|uniref:Berberine/berberine-like domain-containing protein n=1 Tax=Streptomyces vastus TaxID=285451 RepID=A0ABP6DCD8_9ACTN